MRPTDVEAPLNATIAALFAQKPTLAAGPSPKRKKLWEIDPSYLCVVIGTCLPMPELRRLARRAGVEGSQSASDYALHRSAIALGGERNELSRLVQKNFERRFAPAVARFAAARSDEELRTLWRESLSRGEAAGPLWALVTHPLEGVETLELASQDLHMLSHQLGASSRADLGRLGALEVENRMLRERLEERAAAAAGQLAARDQRIATLELRLAEQAALERRLGEAEQRLRELHGREAMPSAIEVDRARRAMAELASLRAAHAELQHVLAQARSECETAERTLRALLDADAPAKQEELSDLCGRCVLYVGGRAGLVEHYRVLVERCGGRFLHHDGGHEDAPKRLQPLLASADAAVCAAGNVSHGAYYLVKRFCKQAGKPCVLLRKPSVSSFVHALGALTGGSLENGSLGTMLTSR